MPGPYQFLYGTSDATTGIKRTSDGATIPPDPENSDWQEFLEWDLTGTPDPYTAIAVADMRKSAKVEVDRQADLQMRKKLCPAAAGGAAVGFSAAMAYREAIQIDGDGSPTSAKYPMLNEMTDHGADMAARGTALRAIRTAIFPDLGKIENVRLTAHIDIDAATTQAAMDAVVDGLSWPA